MTRDGDVREAARLGASYVGTILTVSPRRVTAEQARTLFSAVDGSSVRTVCVFGDEPLDDVIDAARRADCDIVQLHGRTNSPAATERLQRELDVEVWHVVRVGPQGIAADERSGLDGADGVLLDTLAVSALGGTGTTFDWQAVHGDVRDLRFGRRLIVAGGLRPDNVRGAIERLAPDVVDVSSGVEVSPGMKDPHRMADFMTAVRQSSSPAPNA
jgi:phosphoribosylanthranilate isomerase